MINKIYKRIHNNYSNFFKYFFFLRYVFAIFLIITSLFLLIPKFFNYEKKQEIIKEYFINYYGLDISQSFINFFKKKASDLDYDLDKIISIQPWENKIKEGKLKNILFYPTLMMSPFNNYKFKKIKTWIIHSLNYHHDEIEFNSSLWNYDGRPISWNTILNN